VVILLLLFGILAAQDYERVYRRGVSKNAVALAQQRSATASRRAREAYEQYVAEHPAG
jgi:hypothetical protein